MIKMDLKKISEKYGTDMKLFLMNIISARIYGLMKQAGIQEPRKMQKMKNNRQLLL
jgi:hypothetical protein